MSATLENQTTVCSVSTARLTRLPVLLLVYNLLIRLMLACRLPLLGREVLLWRLGRFPSLGYAGHPPIPLWITWLCHRACPTNPMAVSRGLALMLGTLTPCLLYWLAKRMFHDRSVARWALLLSLCVPALNVVGIVLMPITLMMPLLLLSIGCFHRALRTSTLRDWCLSGSLLGLALMCDLLASLPLAGATLFLLQRRPRRSHLCSSGPWIALLFTTLFSMPLLYWNSQHHWANFAFLIPDLRGTDCGFSFTRIGGVLLEQIPTAGMLVIPILGCLFLSTTRLPPPARKAHRLLRSLTGVVLTSLLMISTVMESHPDWSLLAYPSAILCLAVTLRWQGSDWLRSRVRRTAMTQITVLSITACAMSMGAFILNVIPTERCTQFTQRRLGTMHAMFFPWDDLENQLGDAPVLLTTTEELAGRVACQRGRKNVLSLESLHDSRTRSALSSGPVLVFAPAGTTMERSLRDLFERVERMPAIEVPGVGGKRRRFRIWEVAHLRECALRPIGSPAQ